MSELQSAVNRLTNMLSPALSFGWGTRICLPEPGDPNASLKRALNDRGFTVRNSGQTALAGRFTGALAEVRDDEFEAIERQLADDPERRDYSSLAFAIQDVVVAVNRSATRQVSGHESEC